MARLTLDGVAATELAARWSVPQCGLFRRLGSTLDAIHDLGTHGAPAGTAVIAEEQTAGRGRDGRTWHSPVGGVWLGLLLRPAHSVVGAVAIRAGLAVADAVDALLGAPGTRLKWPNDVLLDDRKIAGILCEGRWQGDRLQWLAVGVGVNVCNTVPAAVGRPAMPALSERECAAFAARDWLRGRQLRSPAAGRAGGLRPDGALLVDLGAGTIGVREGHVELA
ncbi:MAG: biotin--[acetyl-CoA-carboxylase] ligase [Gemmatimonadetes bacterium 13_2_20CM_69_8]|nr:MAG: biotin--[acetyl-CoA-carboxylase] ligase [Gemmatimonadetes bacterium 13_2_20CM_69_8]